MRPSGRAADQLREVTLERGISPYAEGSCAVEFGQTRLICTASVETTLPPWRRGQGLGWVTSEYGMLPRSTTSRMRREASTGRQSGRTQEIQRLIGRSLRAVTDLGALGENQIIVDCDVIQADGGTRTAAITGAFVALSDAVRWMQARQLAAEGAIRDHCAAVSCGVFRGTPLLDLDYAEDSEADTDANFVLTGSGDFVEIQATAEAHPLSSGQFEKLIELARKGAAELVAAQKAALAG
jgi:ribonuclease PH